MQQFIHLRIHTSFSLSEGASSYKDLLKVAEKDGMPALGIADKNNLFAALDYSALAREKGIQPLIGCQLYMMLEKGMASFTVIAKNERGYKNLCELLRAACDPRKDASGKKVVPELPNVEPEVLARLSGDLILLTGGQEDGLLPTVAYFSQELAIETYNWLLYLFGDRLYMEIGRSGRPGEAGNDREKFLIDLAYGKHSSAVECLDGVVRSEAPLVATTEVWYSTKEKHEDWLLLKAVVNKKILTIDGDHVISDDAGRYYLRSQADMNRLFEDLPEAIENTVNIAQRCCFDVKNRKSILPPFPTEGGRSEADELKYQAKEGLTRRLDKIGQDTLTREEKEVYWKRLDHELNVISAMEFPGYFLIVSDFIKWAKSKDIPVGPGRGSGAGSLVAWSLTITDINPLDYGLLFERFLNIERVSMPDFDIDFCEVRRGEVIDYVHGKYGSDLVAQIPTFSQIKAKMAIKDAGRQIVHKQMGDFHYRELNSLAQTLPSLAAQQKNLAESYEHEELFRKKIDSSDKFKMLYKRALGIEGAYRSMGTHAAGVVIGDRPLHELIPIIYDAKNDKSVCGFSMKGVDTAGLVKFDFLGLKNLSIIHETIENIKKFKGISLDLSSIALDDPEVFKRFTAGFATGVFQFEGGGMRSTLKDIKPTRIEDLIAVTSLYRPGPMDFIKDYAARKNGLQEIPYPTPIEKTKPILEETYGIMVYQEQVMQIAQAVAGYSLGAADLLRRAMGKKIRSEMEMQRKIFIDGDEKSGIPGAVKLGTKPREAGELFDNIAKFADYGFNKSHAAAYSLISYQTMWLKVHYPVEFYSALMSYNMNKSDKLSMIKDELDIMQIPLLPPDINRSFDRFKPEKYENGYDGLAVRFGFSCIKGISGDLQEFLDNRKKLGDFKSFEDFNTRVGQHFNKSKLLHLSEAGAFEPLNENRAASASILAYLVSNKSKAPANQDDLFGSASFTIPESVSKVEEWKDGIRREYDAVGFYFRHHPIDRYVSRLFAAGVRRRASIESWMLDYNLLAKPKDKISHLNDKKLCVMINDVQMRTSANGSFYLLAFVSEKNDKYTIRFNEDADEDEISGGDNSGETNIEKLRKKLVAAKNAHSLKVILANLRLSVDKRDQSETIWITGKKMWNVEEYLANIQADVVITLQAKANQLTTAEENHLDDIRAKSGSGEISVEEYEKLRRAFINSILDRLSDSVETYLAETASTNNANGAQVRIRSSAGEIVLPGKYQITSATQGFLKSMPGVISVFEEVDGKKKVEEPKKNSVETETAPAMTMA